MKNYLSDGRSYEVLEDGSVRTQCKVCWKEEVLPPNHPYVKSVNEAGSGSFGDYTCRECFLKQKAEFAKAREQQKREDINWGQSWNLAVAMVAPLRARVDASYEDASYEEWERRIEEWQDYFYQKLKEKEVDSPEEINQ